MDGKEDELKNYAKRNYNDLRDNGFNLNKIEILVGEAFFKGKEEGRIEILLELDKIFLANYPKKDTLMLKDCMPDYQDTFVGTIIREKMAEERKHDFV